MYVFVHLLSVGSGAVDKGPRLEEPDPKPDTLSQNLYLSVTSTATVAFTPLTVLHSHGVHLFVQTAAGVVCCCIHKGTKQ